MEGKKPQEGVFPRQLEDSADSELSTSKIADIPNTEVFSRIEESIRNISRGSEGEGFENNISEILIPIKREFADLGLGDGDSLAKKTTSRVDSLERSESQGKIIKEKFGIFTILEKPQKDDF